MNSTNKKILAEWEFMSPYVGIIGGFYLLASGGTQAALQGPTAVAITLIGLGIVFVGMGVTTKQRWNVAYKGHQIRFENSPIFAEKLFIDDELIARGGLVGYRLPYRLELRGTIKTGEGKGDQILSASKAGLLKFRCRIIAEPGSQA